MKTHLYILIAILSTGAALLIPVSAIEPGDRIDLEGYKNARLLKVEPDGIRIQHATGISKIPLEDLPAEMAKSLGLQKKSADAYRKVNRAKDAQKRLEKQQAKWLEETALFVERYTVAEIHPQGLRLKRFRVLGKGKGSSAELRDEAILLDCNTSGHVDGGKYFTKFKLYLPKAHSPLGQRIRIWPCGTYAYSTVLGASRTIPAYTVSPDKALSKMAEFSDQ